MSSSSTYHTDRTLRQVSQLVQAGLVAPQHQAILEQVADRYLLAIPPHVQSLLQESNNPALLRQFVPSPQELQTTPAERNDPIGDQTHSPVPGLVHRYPDRVLLKPILVCPVYCRFCFRRASVGDAGASLTDTQLQTALDYIAAHPEVREIILTGGDPLMLPFSHITRLSQHLAAIPHVDIIRWHSRVPIADPARITPDLAAALAAPFQTGKAVWVSIHCNHPAELVPASRQAITHLRRAGLPLVSQTVLLKGVNDDAAILESLFRALVGQGIKPYYLHHPDLAPGTAHFRPSISQGQDLVRQLRGRLTGIAHPTYVLDIPGGAGKSPLTPDYWNGETGCVTDWQGGAHAYE